ncbi:hypothetical protein FBU30_001984 [Linnemannia zychae]|nr:hypothetical protein FBU30_001984 [Linnemannia zychae]
MDLPYEAIYLTHSIGCFEIPEEKSQLGLLSPAIALLVYVKGIASKTLGSIINRPAKPPVTHPWTRPSFYLKSIKIPAALPPAVEIDM